MFAETTVFCLQLIQALYGISGVPKAKEKEGYFHTFMYSISQRS